MSVQCNIIGTLKINMLIYFSDLFILSLRVSVLSGIAAQLAGCSTKAPILSPETVSAPNHWGALVNHRPL